MPVTRIEYSAGALIDGWPSSDIEQIDTAATEANLANILRNLTDSPRAEVVVTWESTKDRILGDWKDFDEERAAYDALRDFPWYDAERWAIWK